MTLEKLRKVAAALKKLRPKWDWEVLSKKQAEADGTFDPACPFIRRVGGTVQVEFCSDGELYIHFADEDDSLFQVATNQTPEEIAREILEDFDGAL